MKNRQIAVAQSRLYPADTISLPALMTKGTADRIQTAFGFQTYGSQASPGVGEVFAFVGGAFEVGGIAYPIFNLAFGSRQIEFQIEAASEIANSFYSALAGLLSDILPNKPDLSAPIQKTEYTTSVTDLNLRLNDLLSSHFQGFIEQSAKSALSPEGQKAFIRPIQLVLQVSWLPVTQPAVRLGDKLLRIEVRQGTRADERVFFIASPTDSRTHEALLAALEESLVKEAS